MITGAIWDVDGVLVDTEPLHWQAWERLFQELGHLITREQYLPLAGYGGHENLAHLCRRTGIPYDPETHMARRWTIYGEIRQQGVPPITANTALVREFAQRYPEIRQAAASSSRRSDVLENLTHAKVVELLPLVICADDRPGIRRKPAPDLYLLAVERLGVPAQNCLAFEDSEAGVLAAKAAGCRCVALPHSFTLHQDFTAADLVIPPGEPRDAAAILRQLE